jgi:hypothetical protein
MVEPYHAAFVWWHKLDLERRRLLLDQAGATPNQARALIRRRFWALSKWARKRIKIIRADNQNTELWDKQMEGRETK